MALLLIMGVLPTKAQEEDPWRRAADVLAAPVDPAQEDLSRLSGLPGVEEEDIARLRMARDAGWELRTPQDLRAVLGDDGWRRLEPWMILPQAEKMDGMWQISGRSSGMSVGEGSSRLALSGRGRSGSWESAARLRHAPGRTRVEGHLAHETDSWSVRAGTLEVSPTLAPLRGRARPRGQEAPDRPWTSNRPVGLEATFKDSLRGLALRAEGDGGHGTTLTSLSTRIGPWEAEGVWGPGTPWGAALRGHWTGGPKAAKWSVRLEEARSANTQARGAELTLGDRNLQTRATWTARSGGPGAPFAPPPPWQSAADTGWGEGSAGEIVTTWRSQNPSIRVGAGALRLWPREADLREENWMEIRWAPDPWTFRGRARWKKGGTAPGRSGTLAVGHEYGPMEVQARLHRDSRRTTAGLKMGFEAAGRLGVDVEADLHDLGAPVVWLTHSRHPGRGPGGRGGHNLNTRLRLERLPADDTWNATAVLMWEIRR